MVAVKPYIQALFVLLLAQNFVFAQSPSLINYNINNALPSNHAYAVAQDRLGYIWILTDNGLVKYDGYDFRIFTTKDGLPSNDIWRISEDNLGNIWTFCTNPKQIGYLKNNRYTGAYRDSIGMFLYNMFHRGDTTYFEYPVGGVHSGKKILVSYDAKNDIINKRSILTAHKKQDVMHLTKDLGVTIVAANGEVKVFEDVFSKELVPRKLCDSILNYYEIMHVSSVTNPVLNSMHLSYRARTDKFFVFKPYDCYIKKGSIKEYGCAEDEHIIMFYYRDRYNDYVLVTNKQLISLDTNLNYQRSLLKGEQFKQLGNVVYAQTDNQLSEWYATQDNGVYEIPFTSKLYKKRDDFDVLKNTTIASNNTHQKTYWYNASVAKLYVVNNERIIDSIQLQSGGAYCHVSESPVKNCIGISTPLSFNLYDTLNNKLSWLTDGKEVLYVNSLVSDINKHISVIGGDHYWYNDSIVHSAKLGLYEMKVSKDTINVNTAVLLNDLPCNDLHFDSLRKIYWAYSVNDIVCYNPENGSQIKYDQFDEILPNTAINNISSDEYGNVYMYNSDQLYLIYPELGVFRKISKGFSALNGKMRLSGDTIVIAAEFGVAYAKINGVNNVDDFKIIPNYKKSVYNRITDISFVNGIVTLNTDKGIYTVNLNEKEISKKIKTVSDNGFASLLLEIPYEQVIEGGDDTLAIDQDAQLFRLNLINFNGSGDVMYWYSIDGESWKRNLSGEVFIANLKPGVYHKILCKAQDDIWQTDTEVLYVYRIPFWYQTKNWIVAFWVLGVLLVCGLVFAIVLLTRSVVARNNEKKQQMTDLQLRAIYSQINPHFIFNSLASALYFIDKKKFDDAYDHVSKFSKLLRAYLKSSQERFVVLADEIKMLRNYIELQQTRFEEKFDYTIKIDKKIPAQSILIPSLLLQPLVENAINHGLFHLVDKGKLNIRFSQDDSSDELICTIEDNGVGRQKAEEIKKDSTDRKESYGTQLTEKLMEIFKNYEQMNVSMQYIDKQPPEHGTIVLLTIKNLKYVV